MTSPSVVTGSQLPTFLRVPPGMTSSRGPAAAELAERAGLILDPWQRFVLDVALGEQPKGADEPAQKDPTQWSAFEVALVVPRQNGKGSILEARTLAGLFLFGERLILHSAHEVKTALEAYRRLRELIEGTPELHKQVRLYSESNGKEGIELHNGARVRFVARSKGSGRGFSADCVILDEAYELSTASMAALLPTLSARPKPQVWYTSSAALATSSQLHALVARGRGAGVDDRLAFLEWAVRDPDVPDDRVEAAVAEANPGLGIRLSMSLALTERRSLGSDWPRERLGVHDAAVGDVEPTISLDAWGALADGDSEPAGGVVFVVDVSPNARSASISMGAVRDDGLGHVELVDHRPGVEWVAARRAELSAQWPAAAWALDPSGPAVELRGDGDWREITAKEAGEAFGWLLTSVGAKALRWRVGSAELAAALADAMHDAVPGTYADGVRRWSRRRSSVDISPLVAVTLAAWAGKHVEIPGDPLLSMW